MFWRPQVRTQLGTWDAENGFIAEDRLYTNISKTMKMKPNRLIS